TAFLDAAVEMELCKACTFNSLRLLDRIWDSSLPETHPSPAEVGPGNGGSWTRRKYLRTDRHYRRFQLRRAIVEAVKIEDAKAALRMVQWLCTKFHGCIVPVTAVHTAAGKGNLDVLKFFKAIEIPGRRDGGAAMRDEIENDKGHVVRWGRHDMEHAAANKQYETITWLYQNTCAPRAMKSTLMTVVKHGDINLLEWLREKYPTRGAMDLAAKNGHLEMVEWLGTHRYEGCTVAAMDAAAGRGHLEVVKWLHRHRSEGCTTQRCKWWPPGSRGVAASQSTRRMHGQSSLWSGSKWTPRRR
ncbi:hypothetical protein PHYSODRAFT_509529, partial [Phytophthora sojae]